VSVLRRMRATEISPARAGWLRRIAQWWRERQHLKHLSIPLSPVDYEGFQAEATLVGLPLAEWARRKLKNQIRNSPAVLDEAFRRIDESDAQREFSTPPPLVAPPSVSQRVSVFGQPVECEHSCALHAEVRRIDGGPPKICAAKQQFGRPCYFPSNRASDCIYFMPKGR
jgi:hypothetical protein